MTLLPIAQQLKAIPTKPGVYQYRDLSGELLYVGKAKNLKSRVSSYFHEKSAHSPRIQAMVAHVVQINVIVTHSETEALILEANLIKTQRPKYNILMRDDKKYPWLILSDELFPRLIYSREPSKRGGREKSFGPYASPGAVYQTLQLTKKIFPLRQRRKPLFKNRPCINYSLGTCMGPCQNLISSADYQKIVDQMVLFLRGQADDLLAIVEKEMKAASEAMDFEKAAQLRDRYQAIITMIERQRVMDQDETLDQDVFGVATTEVTAYIAVLKVRKGRLIQTMFFEVPLDGGIELQEAFRSFLLQFYQDNTAADVLPTELVMPFHIHDEAFLAEWISAEKRKKITITVPQRGKKSAILEMATNNAQESSERSRINQESKLKNDAAQALFLLQEKLGLAEVPHRIECYDISHTGGTHTVASMVVFTDGVADKKEYRRFRIRSVPDGKPDDFQSMVEVMTRRFSNREEKGWDDPDLVIIDGGKGQLSSAYGAVKALGITDQAMISLAKKFEEVYFPGESRPIIIERDSMALFLLQKIRDEAHRFAITYNRNIRGKSQTRSFLDAVHGIGETRKKRLHEGFESLKALQSATVADIGRVTQTTGKTAESLHQALQQAFLDASDDSAEADAS